MNVSSVMNISQKCGDEKGNFFVPMYDWTTYLGGFSNKVVDIKKNYHFKFTADCSVVEKKFYRIWTLPHRIG